MPDPWSILGLTRRATPDEIRAAYRRLARELHPDVCDRPDAAERFAAVAQAYELLTDPARHPPASRPVPTDHDEAEAVYDAFFRTAAAERAARRPPPPPYRAVPGTLDLLLDLPLSAREAARGVTVSVPTPAGPADLTIPPGTPDAREFRIVAHGARGRADARGDLRVRVRITPQSGTDPAQPPG